MERSGHTFDRRSCQLMLSSLISSIFIMLSSAESTILYGAFRHVPPCSTGHQGFVPELGRKAGKLTKMCINGADSVPGGSLLRLPQRR
eukprot:gene26093-biopygen13811